MNIKKIKDILEEKGEVFFEIYNLEYKIYKNGDKYTIYPLLYIEVPKTYDTLDILFNSYLIYNERIIDNDEKILCIK